MSRSTATPPELPGYTFVRVLGSGGFSDVYLYQQELPRRLVAIKVLLADALTSASRAAFIAEANTMAQLSSHPYIVTIYHAGVSADDRPYLVMEYAPGASLAERYKRAPLSTEEVLRTGVRLSSAIATAHAADILHRDIKPANVLTTEFGWPALTDFGIASAASDSGVPVHTTTRGALDETAGTTESRSVGLSVPWSPPEMFEDDPRPDVRSDVFSLAATIYTLLAGQTPFEVRGRSNSAIDLMGRIERGDITPLGRPDVPASLIAILRKGMDVDRERRFATAVDFARALQRVELELGFAPTPIDVPNLIVEEPQPVDDGADETRLRTVQSIDAQPVAPAATPAPQGDETRLRPAPVVVPQANAPEHTVLRSRPEPAAPPAPAAEAPHAAASAPDPAPKRGRAGLIAGIAAAVVVVVGAVVGVSVLASSGILSTPEPEKTSVAQPGGGSAVVGGAIDAPEIVSVSREDGDVLVVEVRDPDYKDGDVFRWYALSNPSRTTVYDAGGAEGRIEVSGVPAGVETCIGVVIQRAGQLSPETEACSS